MPPFGWSLVTRLDPDPIIGVQERFRRTMLIGAAAAFIIAMLAILLMSSMAFRPLITLVDQVSRMSKGEDVGYVPETRAYREATRLSNAIARFQARRNE